MDDRLSTQRLMMLHPAIRNDAIAAYNEAVRITPVGVHPVVIQTLRTFAESELLYEQGRTRPGSIVTNAKPGQSYHNYGLAIDLALQINGKTSWNVDENWLKMIGAFKRHGFEWGGDWHSLKDYPHVEKRLGFDWRQLLVMHNQKNVDQDGYVNILNNVA